MTDQVAHWGEQLRAQGLRLTPQRRAILQAIATQRHPNQESILTAVSTDYPDLNRSTVYRALATLEELGLIQHTHLGTGPVIYHLASAGEHLHLICNECGRTRSMPVSAAQELRERAAAVGFSLSPAHTALYGVCAECETE